MWDGIGQQLFRKGFRASWFRTNRAIFTCAIAQSVQQLVRTDSLILNLNNFATLFKLSLTHWCMCIHVKLKEGYQFHSIKPTIGGRLKAALCNALLALQSPLW